MSGAFQGHYHGGSFGALARKQPTHTPSPAREAADRAQIDAAIAAGRVTRLPSLPELAKMLSEYPDTATLEGSVAALRMLGHTVQQTGRIWWRVDGEGFTVPKLYEIAAKRLREHAIAAWRRDQAAAEQGA